MHIINCTMTSAGAFGKGLLGEGARWPFLPWLLFLGRLPVRVIEGAPNKRAPDLSLGSLPMGLPTCASGPGVGGVISHTTTPRACTLW